jgi:hypothetical protein
MSGCIDTEQNVMFSLKDEVDASQRRCELLKGPAPIGWSTGFSYKIINPGYIPGPAERAGQLAYLETME